METIEQAIESGRIREAVDLISELTRERSANGLSGPMLVEALTSEYADRPAGGSMEVVARPGERISPNMLREGDVLVRRGIEGNLTHAAMLAGAELVEADSVPDVGWRAERTVLGLRPGLYARVIEGGSVPAC